MNWINALWRPVRPAPRRILVAGCGTGMEARALAHKFPGAEITGVDFSPRSISAAREWQRRAAPARRIRFCVGDLAGRSFARTIGRDYDFISCHGVLSYIPQPARVLRNLAGCLAPDGALYLGVNGATHFSSAWRRVLPAFGFNLTRFDDGARLRKVLELCDAVAGRSGSKAKRQAWFLASDLFGPLNRAWPLAEWNRLARAAGLHCLGELGALTTLRPALTDGLCELLIPRSRAEVAEFLDALQPLSFHRMVLTQKPATIPPWDNAETLLDCRPRLTRLYVPRWPRRRSTPHGSWQAEFRSRATDTLVELSVPGWELEMLRRSKGRRSLRQILAPLGRRPSSRLLRSELYRLYQLTLLDLLPPPALPRESTAPQRKDPERGLSRIRVGGRAGPSMAR